MMKKSILIITLIYASCFNCSSQVNSLLQKALAKYSQTQSFACECFVATDVPINFSFSCKMEASRNPLDTICGFYYYIKYVPGDNTSDFSLYNGSDTYMSHKGKITQINRLKKPDAFKDKVYNAGKSIRPSVVSSPTMFSFSLFEIENNIRKDLNDSTLKFVARNDTVIDMVNCFQFSFRKADMIKQICIE